MEKYKVVYIRMGWIASTLSDFQTFGIMCGAFAVNVHLIENNGWLNALLFVCALLWLIARSSIRTKKSKHIDVLDTTDKEEAIAFIRGEAGE